jgi:hypothetical protein
LVNDKDKLPLIDVESYNPIYKDNYR